MKCLVKKIVGKPIVVFEFSMTLFRDFKISEVLYLHSFNHFTQSSYYTLCSLVFCTIQPLQLLFLFSCL